jgi:LmbE family N-acetylglucosaminyl deacetylase
MKVLAVGAHPDDIEIFMYGLLSIFKSSGNKIFLCIATDGSEGNVLFNKNLKTIRAKEAISGLSNLGKPDFLELKDGNIKEIPQASTIIKNYIRNIAPDLIVTHPPEDYHPDHRSLSEYVVNAASFMCPVLYSETLMGVNFYPDYYIDISQKFEEKSKALLCHKSQSPKKFLEAVKLMNRYRAAQCNAPSGCYAEVYRYEKKFPFADLASYLPERLNILNYYNKVSKGFL